MAETRAQSNRRIRQEALREQLQAQGHVQYVVENIKKMEELAAKKLADYDSLETYIAELSAAKDKVYMLNTATDKRLKLINKYLPDVKSVEVVDEDGNDALPRSIQINVVSPTS